MFSLLKRISYTIRDNLYLVTSKICKFSMDAGKHWDQTKHIPRNGFVQAYVTDICQESPTVKTFNLKISDSKFSFKAGQWVDTFVDGMDTIGGFSIVSSPSEFKKTGNITLGVKYADEPPAYWFHRKCDVGRKFKIRVGGNFFLEMNEVDNILLIGGGVGINPLLSMMSEFAYNSSSNFKKLKLLYMAKSQKELLYCDKISALLKENGNLRAQYFCTSESAKGDDIIYERIDQNHLDKCIQELGKSNLAVYICGPIAMIDNVLKLLKVNGIHNKVYYEKWW